MEEAECNRRGESKILTVLKSLLSKTYCLPFWDASIVPLINSTEGPSLLLCFQEFGRHHVWQLILYVQSVWERSGSVVECLTRDRGAAGSSLTGVTALCPLARSLILA